MSLACCNSASRCWMTASISLNASIREPTSSWLVLRARKTSHDEVGSLIDAFNEMLAVIQQRDAELQQANDMLEVYNVNLERKVEERTAELVRATAEAQEARSTAEDANRAKSAFL